MISWSQAQLQWGGWYLNGLTPPAAGGNSTSISAGGDAACPSDAERAGCCDPTTEEAL